jgi:DNA-binding beta-propeller fold protein YncE
MSYAQDADQDRVRAPEFKDVQWLNTDKPIQMKDLKGQVVLLDFWTYCCINCMHIFPDLRYLEHKYHDKPLVVIGVHSGKFSQEKDPENIRQAILRHNIAHPVAVDSEYEIWNSYGVRAWPTLVVIDPEGYVVGGVSGEGHRETLDKVIGDLLKKGAEKKTLGKPLQFRQERASFKSGVLEFPGKVLADARGKRLFISDTNHHRVLVSDFEGQVQAVIGKGEIGLKDGPFETAQFHQPQGLAISADGNTLYIADTENHAIRAAHLKERTVTAIAGTGKQARDFHPDGNATQVDLSSPWDLALVGPQLFTASAGTHQIWVMDLDAKRVKAHAGTGRELRTDGPNASAAFAQPSGLASDGERLYVADSEISTIRIVETKAGGSTSTLAGSGDLFGFGAKDGIGDEARFQHPLGVALHGNEIFVADTFNHLIRRIDLKTREVTTWLGNGKTDAGTIEKIGLFEPGGISIAGDTLYIADTNHHRVIAVDISTKQVRPLRITLPATQPAAD